MIHPTSWRGATLATLALSTLLVSTGCRTTGTTQPVWPEAEVLPQAPPDKLEKTASTSVLRRGPDGFMYIVGGLDEATKPGATFFARYSGQWPLEDVARPPLAAGQITRVYGEDVALVQMLYAFPNVELEKLEITWQDDITREDIGKGIGAVTQIMGEPEYPDAVELSLGKNLGVQPGDIYALLHAPDESITRSNRYQLSRRLANVCMVQKVHDATATCRIWHGSQLHPQPAPTTIGNTALFVEHTFGAQPRQALVQFAKIKGDEDGSVRAHLIEQMDEYLKTHAAVNVSVETVDIELDPSSPEFYKNEKKVEYRSMPQLLVGAALQKGPRGKEHLILNYTGVGPSTGPGMVAAPPEYGIDLGRGDKIDGEDLRHIYGLLLSGVLVYRGQTAEGLMHLRQMLADESIQGSLRWHLRDQYAMRWGALGYLDEALWLVKEDEAVAVAAKNRQAELNALGTRVRLHDMLDSSDAAKAASKRYLDYRSENPDEDFALRAASSMHAEMLMRSGAVTEALEHLATLEDKCPEGCNGELFSYISGIYWAVPPDNKPTQDQLLEKLSALASNADDASTTASLRIYQGLQAMRDGHFEQAVIAFLDAEKHFEQEKSSPGVARAKYFAFLAQLGMKEPIQAYETAIDALSIATDLRDFGTAARIYDRLTAVYLNLDLNSSPSTYIKLASRILTSVYEAQVAVGDLGASSETLFTIGTLFFKLGSLDDAQTVFQKSVVYAIRTTRFDIAAMSHLTLGMIARAKGDIELFKTEIERAGVMAKLSGDPSIIEAIQRALEPPRQPEDDPVDSQLL